ncbi:MAG: CYTH domain-containing protein [Bacteroidales bacterium]|nr:CYTH domain-containing protein [Candidatus Liminaster caballi]
MGKEIERKFLVESTAFVQEAPNTATDCTNCKRYHQGYIPTLNGMTVRIRIAGDKGYVTLKDHAVGFTRHEFEYEIPVDDARQMLGLMCEGPQIEKVRYVIPASQHEGDFSAGLKWEVDVFRGDNEGLIVAEIEVPSEDTEFDRPSWLGNEVTGDKRYYNSHLCRHPYKEWK